jgi:hypothetical protein
MASSNGLSLEQRLARLENEVQEIKQRLENAPQGEQPWWKSIVGTHENDPDFAEIVRLGSEIRKKDLVPVWKKRRTKRKAARKGTSKE